MISNSFIDLSLTSIFAFSASTTTLPVKVPSNFIFSAFSVDMLYSSDVAAGVFIVIVSPAFAFANTVFKSSLLLTS